MTLQKSLLALNKTVCAIVRGVDNARSPRSRKFYRLPNQICYDSIIENQLWRKTSIAFKPICRIRRNAIRNQKRRGGSQFVSPVIDSRLLGSSSETTTGGRQYSKFHCICARTKRSWTMIILEG